MKENELYKWEPKMEDELNINIQNLLNKTRLYQFKGWDPYDILNCKTVSSRNLRRSTLIFLTQLNRISPLNFRRFANINRIYNSKAMALFLSAILNLPSENNSAEKTLIKDWLIQNKNSSYDEYTIGFTYDITLRGYSSGPGEPSLIITLFVMYAFINYYQQTSDSEIADQIFSFKDLIERELPRTETSDSLGYSYHFDKFSEIYNATAKIGKFYSLLYSVYKDDSFLEKIEKILNYFENKQRPDGSWEYAANGFYTDGFHTAFVLESIDYMLKYVKNNNHIQMFNKGLRHYENHLFEKNNQPIHYHKLYSPKDPRKYLIKTDIRDCAMAIILFSRIGQDEKAKNILSWTLNNMFSPKRDYFYYYKNNFWTNKIEFIRWQAWMLYALSVYKQNNQ